MKKKELTREQIIELFPWILEFARTDYISTATAKDIINEFLICLGVLEREKK